MSDNKIELSPSENVKATIEKDATNNGVKASGITTVGKDDNNALIFKNGASNSTTASLKVGGNELTFTKASSGDKVKISNVEDGQINSSSYDAITGKQLDDLANKLGVKVKSDKTGFEDPEFATPIKGAEKPNPTTFKDAIDGLISSVNKGITFKGNDPSQQGTSTTLQLGGTLNIDSSESKKDSSSSKEKDIKVTLTPNNSDPTSAGTLKLELSKSTSIDENDERVVTSKAVATKLKEYTTTTKKLGEQFLKVDGSNINGKKKEFGQNVGISKINLNTTDKSSSELVQASAVIDYLKGKGDKSVKISDNPETKAEGVGSIAIGDKAVAQNEGSISIGENSGAK